MRATAIGIVRERLPQLLQQLWQGARARIGKASLRPPRWPEQAAALRWISWPTMLAALLLAGIVHICFVFAASLATGGPASELLIEQLPRNRMTVLPQQSPGKQILPELPPDMLYAMCRYDLREGAVAVRATVLGPGWALSVHTPQGSNIYVLTGQPARSIDVAFLLVPSAPDAASAPIIPRRERLIDTQIASPTLEGVIILRAPIRGLAWTAETEAILRQARCAVAKP